jgi:regulator of protease activity HflC (stomatin/prohibitin superfamily)
LVFLLPFIDLAAVVDLREQAAQFKADAAVTQDKVLADIELTIRYRVIDPVEIVQNVGDFHTAIEMASKSALQAIIGKQVYSDLVLACERVGAEVRDNLRATVKDWGLEILSVDLSEPTKRQSA